MSNDLLMEKLSCLSNEITRALHKCDKICPQRIWVPEPQHSKPSKCLNGKADSYEFQLILLNIET